MRKTHLPLLAAIGWFIISIILLTIPGTAFPQEDWLEKIWFDKWVHIGMFAVMVILWCFAWLSLKRDLASSKLRQVFMVMAIIFFGYGIAMEFVQLYFVAHRSFDFGDIVADAVGCAAGMFISTRRYIKK
ncbi:MAG TPA: VanZ family protein [Chitinophagaceae bacterium]